MTMHLPTPALAETSKHGHCAVASGSLPLYALECDNLIRAAKLIDAEANTWADGWAIYEIDGSLSWDKDGEWAKIRWMKLKTSSENLRKIAARFVKKANAQVVTCRTEGSL